LARALQVVDGLLAFARTGARPEPGARARVRPTIEGVLEELRAIADEGQVDLRVEAPEDAVVACNPGILSSIVGNLVGNAVKFIGNGSTRRVTLRVRSETSAIRIEVEDTGPGLTQEERLCIFEPFVRTRSDIPGIGLGLATVRRLVEGHDGSVGVEAAPGGGCLFWVALPQA
jgi:signal transduction histidine kinase